MKTFFYVIRVTPLSEIDGINENMLKFHSASQFIHCYQSDLDRGHN